MQYLQTASVNQHLSALNEYQCVSAEGLAIIQFSRQTSSKRTFYCHTGLAVWGQRRRSVIQDVWELALVPEREREVVQLSHLHSRLGGSGEGSAREGRHRSLLSRTRSLLSTHNLPTLLCLTPLVRRCCQLFSLPRPYKPLRHISSRLPRGMRRIRDLTHFRESSFIFSGGESK